MILNEKREILFRGKLKNGIWELIYGYWENDKYGGRVYPKTIGQYTGINDCNGKKIFEHDIVHCRISPRLMLDDFDKLFEDVPKELTGQVVMDKGVWVVKDRRGISFQLGYVYESKVLGNVFDDFELLEEQT